jgi:hypothetical protein
LCGVVIAYLSFWGEHVAANGFDLSDKMFISDDYLLGLIGSDLVLS